MNRWQHSRCHLLKQCAHNINISLLKMFFTSIFNCFFVFSKIKYCKKEKVRQYIKLFIWNAHFRNFLKWSKDDICDKIFLGNLNNTLRLPCKCHCKRMACLSHSDLWPQVSISGHWACRPGPVGQWWCFWMPVKGLRRRSWRAGGRSPLRCRVLLCWGCPQSEAHAGSPLSPRQPGPAHRRVNITLQFCH